MTTTWSDDDQTKAAAVARRVQNERLVVVLHSNDNTLDLTHRKFVTGNSTFAEFVMVVRRYCKISPSQALFYFFHDSRSLVPLHKTLKELSEHFDHDNLLHITVAVEHAFGAHTHTHRFATRGLA